MSVPRKSRARQGLKGAPKNGDTAPDCPHLRNALTDLRDFGTLKYCVVLNTPVKSIFAK